MDFQRLAEMLGVGAKPSGWRGMFLPAVGVAFGILATGSVSASLLGGAAGLVLAASMGASAVLVFGAPGGPFSQPWPVMAGHTISALAGCLAVRLCGPGLAAGALAVGVAMAAMTGLRCVHPPGGSTALAVVVSAMAGSSPSMGFALNPVFMNATVLVLAGSVWHRLVSGMAYPAGIRRGA